MTVVIGVVTVAAVGVVTVTVAIGVLTVTVAATVAGGGGTDSAGRATVGTGSVEGDRDGATAAVAERRDAAVAARLELCVEAGTALTLEARSLLR